jgi:pimeloyl-ACP methyl ester carboxylesterase
VRDLVIVKPSGGTMTNVPERRTTTLSDGRELSYIEAGDRDGVPLLFTVGSPSSATGGLAFADAAATNGVRLISIDKPGYGRSTRDRHRSLVRYGHDVAELADALGLGQVALAGQSGGGPHALAAAHVLGPRVSTLTLIASFGPATEASVRLELNPLMRSTVALARNAPWLMGATVGPMKLMLGNAARAERLVRRSAAKMSPDEREAMEDPRSIFLLKGAEEAFENFSAVCDEFRAIGRPWGFAIDEVQAPTDLWHGTDDANCSIATAREVARLLPHATLHELPGKGHAFFGADLSVAMANVRAKAWGL